MAALRLRGHRKLHWNAEEAKRRVILAETVGRLPAMHLVSFGPMLKQRPNGAVGCVCRRC